MLTSHDTSRAAALLADRLGEIAVAAAILRSQEAGRRGELIEMVNWRRIAEQALRRFAPEYTPA
jgi:hypothetical protein